jgi:hypothetical protein
MIEARGPNGEIHRYPDDITQEQIDSDLSKIYGKKEQESPQNQFMKALESIGKPIDVFSRNAIASGLDTIQRIRKKNAEFAKETGFGINNKPEEFNKDYYASQGISPEEKESIAGKAGQIAPEFGALLWNPEGIAIKEATKIPKALEYFKDFLKTGTSQGAIGAAFNPENPVESFFLTGGLGGFGSTVGKAVGSGSPWGRTIGRLSLMGAGAGTGYFGSQALGAPRFQQFLSAGAGALFPNIFLRNLKPAEAIEKGAIKQSLESILPVTKEPEIKALYNKSYYKTVPSDPYDINPSFKQENAITVPEKIATDIAEKHPAKFKKLKNDMLAEEGAADRLRGVPENSVEFLDSMKKQADKMIYKEGNTDYVGIRKDIIGELEKVSPSYKEARQTSQLNIKREELEDFLYQKGFKGKSFADFFANPKVYDDYLKAIKNSPDAVSQIKEMKKVFDVLEDIKPPKNLDKLKIWENIWKTHKYDKAMRELATNPAFKGTLDDLIEATKIENGAEEFIKVLTKISQTSSLKKKQE